MKTTHQHETQFALVHHSPENAAGLEEGYNRAWLLKLVSLHDTHDEAEAAKDSLERTIVESGSEWDYVEIVSPEWYLSVLRQENETSEDSVPF